MDAPTVPTMQYPVGGARTAATVPAGQNPLAAPGTDPNAALFAASLKSPGGAMVGGPEKSVSVISANQALTNYNNMGTFANQQQAQDYQQQQVAAANKAQADQAAKDAAAAASANSATTGLTGAITSAQNALTGGNQSQSQHQAYTSSFMGGDGKMHYWLFSTDVTDKVNNPGSAGNGTTTAVTPSGNSYTVTGDSFMDQRAALNADDAAKAAQAQKDLATAATTAGLTPDQQQQLTNLGAQYDSLVKDQQNVNAMTEGANSMALGRSGSDRYAPAVAASVMSHVISDGVSKVTSLQTQKSSALSQLQTAFENDNVAAVQAQYKIYTDLSAKQTQAINDMQTHLDTVVTQKAAAEKAKTDLAYQNFQDQISAANLTLAQGKDVFDRYMQQANLDEKKKVDAVDMWAKQQDIILKRQAAAPTAPGNMPVVQVNAGGVPNSQSQRDYLAQLTPSIAGMIKGMADYSINPADFATRLAKGDPNLTRSQAVALVKQYDPTYDDSQWQARQQLRNNFTSGKYSQNITALNTAAAHVTELEKAFSDLKNKSGLLSLTNKLSNSFLSNFGSGRVTSADSNIKAAVDEMATAFKGGTATNQEIDQWAASINRNASPSQSKAFINKAIQLLGDRLNNLDETYAQGMGKPSTNGFLHDSVAAQLLDLKSKGYNVDIPALQENASVKLSTLAQDKNTASVIAQIRQIAPNITPEELLSQLGVQ